MEVWRSPVIIFATFAGYSLLHSLLASHTIKDRVSSLVGKAAYKRYYRVFFNLVGLLTLLPVLWLVAVLPDQHLYTIPYPWRWLSYAGQIGGLLLVAASLRVTGALDFLGLRQLASGGEAPAPELSTDGPYAWVRHPLYTGSMLVLWLLPVMTANLLALVLSISLYFGVGAHFEERKLVSYFGRAYAEYKEHTPMFIPWRGPSAN